MPVPDRGRTLLTAMLLLFCAASPALAAEEPAEDTLELRSVTYRPQIPRDPFQLPKVDTEGKSSSEELDLRSATLVGIVKLTDGYIALVEDENGESYTLAKGDPIWRGRVSTIDEESLAAWMRNGDVRQRVELELVTEGE